MGSRRASYPRRALADMLLRLGSRGRALVEGLSRKGSWAWLSRRGSCGWALAKRALAKRAPLIGSRSWALVDSCRGALADGLSQRGSCALALADGLLSMGSGKWLSQMGCRKGLSPMWFSRRGSRQPFVHRLCARCAAVVRRLGSHGSGWAFGSRRWLSQTGSRGGLSQKTSRRGALADGLSQSKLSQKSICSCGWALVDGLS